MTDREMLEATMEWPYWPVLPMKKRKTSPGEFPECGFIFDDGKARVYKATIYDLPERAANLKWKDVLAKFEFDEYQDIDELLNTWMVD